MGEPNGQAYAASCGPSVGLLPAIEAEEPVAPSPGTRGLGLGPRKSEYLRLRVYGLLPLEGTQQVKTLPRTAVRAYQWSREEE